jgi:spermidine synthase
MSLKPALAAAVFLSGASALLLETLLFRQSGLALGNSVWASSLVLASFMAGLAVGNALAARHAVRVTRPLAGYAVLEALVAASGVGLVFAWPAIGTGLVPAFRLVLDAPLALAAARLAVAFLLMLAPAAAMGATLPLLARALGRLEPSLGRVLGALYGWNTLGAVAGAVAGEALLVGRLGIRGTALVAGALNVAAAAVALSLSRGLAPRPPSLATSGGAVPALRTPWRPLGAAFLCGATLLALEVVWFRFLSLFLVGTSLTFALMLAVVLLGIGAGGLAASAWLRVEPGAARFVRPLLLAAGALTVVTYGAFHDVEGLVALSASPGRVLAFGARLMLAVPLLSGVAFTLLGHGCHVPGADEALTVGRLTMANTLGALAGSLAGGFVLLPLAGMERSLAVLAVAYGVAAFLAPGPGLLEFPGRIAAATVGGTYALSLLLFPSGLMERYYLGVLGKRFGADGSRIVAVREGTSETVLYMRRDLPTEPPVFRLVTNGFSMSGTTLSSRRYMTLYAWWPAALHPDLRRALLISYGVGVTGRALTSLRGLERIDIVDTSRDVLDMSRVAQPRSVDPLRDPRVRIHVEDGRQYLQTTSALYDLITGEPPPPHAAGVVSLYTLEYFRLMKARLAPGGIATYWLPVEQLQLSDTRAILGAFCGAFPDCSLWSGSNLDWMLVGTNGLAGPVPEERFVRPWRDTGLRSALAEVGFELPEQLGALFLADAADLRELIHAAPPLVDDFPGRIMADPTPERGGAPLAAYDGLMETGAASVRFARSPFVRGLWPESLRQRTLGYFEWQRAINSGFRTLRWWRPPSLDGLAELDATLTRSSLRTLPLWLLGTSDAEQRVVSRLVARGGRPEELIGLGALADRDFDAAAEAFARAPGAASVYRRAYALGLAGRAQEMAALARDVQAHAGRPEDARFWAWLDERFRAGGGGPAPRR